MSSLFFMVTMGLYFLSTVGFLAYLLRRVDSLSKISLAATGIGFVTHTIALVLRMVGTDRSVFPSFHEALSFFSWMLILVFLAVEFRRQIHVLGSFIVPLALISLVTAAAFRSDEA